MIEKQVSISNKLGLHARAAAKFVAMASGFDCQIDLEKNDRRVNGKSIMGVMMLAASKGTSLMLYTNGNDEIVAIDALAALIDRKFDEKE